ncbi:conserved hypothetical protein [Streptomyces pristinaespiralis ATCC 25486]|uniref:Hydrogenase expression protein HypF n=1 Tax=Streptomyces pristinaespiralis (strain ATCC 25486 / DSM 40338 / CBS 914.69 / JCM 4507 / KCC S-0507 / NBRC 13074 / NRRL 2958 / 5647) TaxID=457429 RepID=B5H9F5_STRE2|nr:conserved hypothetical protein [Streptomyces pristinaespiralis ATCC 25486]
MTASTRTRTRHPSKATAGGTVPGDVTPPLTADAGGDGSRERKGPRHAAPRKSLFHKFQMPASKAIALAAMPTAVFVGMGLTPKLALADDKDIPFAPGPCVTRSDEPSQSPSPSASESAKPSESPSPSDSADPEPTPSATSGTGTGDEEQEPKPAESPSASAAGSEQAAPAPEPSPSQSTNPLDPLGVGDKVKDLIDDIGDTLKGEPTETPSPSETATQPAEEPSTAPSEAPAEEPAEKPADAVDETVDKTKEAIKDAADKAGAEVEELDEDVKGLDPKQDEDIPDGAKPRFPCPTPDPDALADAQLEPGRPLLPDEPWILESSMLTLTGLDYHGIVEVKTGSGKIKKVLKFTATGVDIKDLHQLVVGPNGTTAHVEADKGSTSTIRDGEVTMYTEELKGNLFGIIPITFSPETPPPLNVPFAMFTDVKVTQAGQFGGTLTVPGLHNYFTGPGA